MAEKDNGERQISVRSQRVGALRELLTKAAKQLQMALPRHLTADRMIRIALSAASRQPRLLECTPESIALALINAGETGLEPNGWDAHLVPYRNNKTSPATMEAQFQADYKGLVQLAYRSGLVKRFDAAAVYSGDEFEYSLGTNGFVRHKPSEEENPGTLKYAYAVAELAGGAVKFVVLNKRQVEQRRASSQAFRGGYDTPWKSHPESMWAKSAAKEICKWIPRSAEMQRAIEIDNASEIGETSRPAGIDVSFLSIPAPEEHGSKSDELADRLSGNGHETAADASATTAAEAKDAVNADLKPALDWRPDLKDRLGKCKNLTDVNAAYMATIAEFKLTADEQSEASEACETRSGDIREGRGGKARQKEMA